jgi:outer membrane immunogenic protein
VQQDWGPFGADDDTGLVVGGQVGCNYQISTWVFGLQGDGAWSDASGTHPDQGSATVTDRWKTDRIASVTGRVGYAWDRLLAYGKGGAAWANHKYDIFDSANNNATVATASETRDGWTVGGGFEYAITNHFTMFFEYNFYDFGTRTVGFNTAAGTQPIDIRDRESIVKVGANWKFGW